MGIHIFPEGICPKMNVIARLEFELAYVETTIHHLSYYVFVTRWVAFVSACVGVGDSHRIPLSVLARNPHKELAREIFHETGRRRGKEGRRAEQGRRQNREGGRTDQSTEVGGNRQSREVDRREQSIEVGGSRLLGCVGPEAGLANVRGWVSIPGGFVGISL